MKIPAQRAEPVMGIVRVVPVSRFARLSLEHYLVHVALCGSGCAGADGGTSTWRVSP